MVGLSICPIALTAMTLTDDREQSLAAGMDMFISKPVNKANLQKRVMEAKKLACK
jgi:CheY-like chemotaxis protein